MIAAILMTLFGRRCAMWYLARRTRWFIERAVCVMAAAEFGPDGVEQVLLSCAQSNASVLTAYDLPVITAEVALRRYVKSGKGGPDVEKWHPPCCPGYKELLENIGSRFKERAA